MVMRSKGSSNIIGAAIVPTRALPNAVFSPRGRLKYAITMKVIRPHNAVIGAVGLGGAVKVPYC